MALDGLAALAGERAEVPAVLVVGPLAGFARRLSRDDEAALKAVAPGARGGLPAVFAWIDQQVRQRRSAGQPVVSLMDGQESLWEMKALCQDDLETVEVLDLLHVTPRLWQAAHLFHPPGSRSAEDFVRTRVHKVLRGEVLSVVRGLRSLATRLSFLEQGRETA